MTSRFLIFWSARLVFRHDRPTLLYDGLLHLENSELDLFLRHIFCQQCLPILNNCLPPFLGVFGVQRFFNPIGPFWLIEDVIHLREGGGTLGRYKLSSLFCVGYRLLDLLVESVHVFQFFFCCLHLFLVVPELVIVGKDQIALVKVVWHHEPLMFPTPID